MTLIFNLHTSKKKNTKNFLIYVDRKNKISLSLYPDLVRDGMIPFLLIDAISELK